MPRRGYLDTRVSRHTGTRLWSRSHQHEGGHTRGGRGHRAHPPLGSEQDEPGHSVPKQSCPSPAWGRGVPLLLTLPGVLSSSGRSPSVSEERWLLPERRGMVSGGSLQVMRRRSSSSPSSGTNFHLEPFGTRQALVLARSAGVKVGHPPPPCCLLGTGRDKHQWGRWLLTARVPRGS